MLRKRIDNIKRQKKDFFTFIINDDETFSYRGHKFPAADLPKVIEALTGAGYTDEDMLVIRIREIPRE